MTSYWVAVTGDDSDPGTFAEPWETVSKAEQTAVAGDDVTFKDGTYDIGTGVDFFTRSGAVGNLIIFQAENSRLAIWSLSANGRAADIQNVDYLSFIGIEFDGSVAYASGDLVYTEDCDNIVFDDCEFTDTAGHCLSLKGNCTNFTIDGCEVHSEDALDAGGKNGIHIEGSGNSDITISNGSIYHNAHNGVDINAGERILIHNCLIYDQDSHCVSIFSSVGSMTIDDITVRDCTIYGGGMWPSMEGAGHCGVRIGDEAENVLILRNAIYGNEGPAVGIWSSSTGPINIYNNTMYDNNLAQSASWADIILVNDDGTDPDVNFKNNIVYNTGVERTMEVENGAAWESALDFDYNLYFADNVAGEEMRRNSTTYATYALYIAAGFEPNSVIDTDPLFTNAGAGDFTLLVGSPAIDAGVDLGYPYQGSAPDIGAFEFSPVPPALRRLLHNTLIRM